MKHSEVPLLHGKQSKCHVFWKHQNGSKCIHYHSAHTDVRSERALRESLHLSNNFSIFCSSCIFIWL